MTRKRGETVGEVRQIVAKKEMSGGERGIVRDERVCKSCRGGDTERREREREKERECVDIRV